MFNCKKDFRRLCRDNNRTPTNFTKTLSSFQKIVIPETLLHQVYRFFSPYFLFLHPNSHPYIHFFILRFQALFQKCFHRLHHQHTELMLPYQLRIPLHHQHHTVLLHVTDLSSQLFTPLVLFLLHLLLPQPFSLKASKISSLFCSISFNLPVFLALQKALSSGRMEMMEHLEPLASLCLLASCALREKKEKPLKRKRAYNERLKIERVNRERFKKNVRTVTTSAQPSPSIQFSKTVHLMVNAHRFCKA